MPAEPIVSAIIVSYNTRDMTLECLGTLFETSDDLSLDVIVVDNASSDGSVDAIRMQYPAVTVIESSANLGFGAANNAGMKEARGQFFLLLNSDAFPSRGAVQTLLAALRDDAKVGIVGPMLLNRDGSLQRSVYNFPTPVQAWLENLWLTRPFATIGVREDFFGWRHDVTRDVPWVVGACMLVRREVFEAVGGFDERFFMYAEEADWQRRVQQAGYRIRFVHAARVTHFGGASGASEPARINRHFFASLDRHTLKHHGTIGLLLLRVAMIIGCSLRVLLWIVAGIIRPARRQIARSKIKLHSWLIYRQLLTRPPAVMA